MAANHGPDDESQPAGRATPRSPAPLASGVTARSRPLRCPISSGQWAPVEWGEQIG